MKVRALPMAATGDDPLALAFARTASDAANRGAQGRTMSIA